MSRWISTGVRCWSFTLWIALLPLPLRADDSTAALLEQLDQRVEISFADRPFEEAMKDLREKLSLQIHVQWRSLEDAGIARDTPVTMQLKDVKASVALELLLDQIGDGEVSYYVRDNLLVITKISDAADAWRPRVFFVKDLVEESAPEAVSDPGPWHPNGMMPGTPGMMGGPGATPPDGSSAYRGMPGMTPHNIPGSGIPEMKHARDGLLDLITAAVAPGSWEEVGGHGTIEYYQGFLVVKHAQRVQDEVAELLDAMREVRRASRAGRAANIPPLAPGGEDAGGLPGRLPNADEAPAEAPAEEEADGERAE